MNSDDVTELFSGHSHSQFLQWHCYTDTASANAQLSPGPHDSQCKHHNVVLAFEGVSFVIPKEQLFSEIHPQHHTQWEGAPGSNVLRASGRAYLWG